MITATAKTHAVLIARKKDGTSAYVTRLRRSDMLTTRRNHALVVTLADAYETQQRLHAVAAGGHYHRDVHFFDVVPVRAPRAKVVRP